MNRISFIQADLKGSYKGKLGSLADQMREEVNVMNGEGYKLVSVTNLTSSWQDENAEGHPYAESFTCGVLLVYEKA